MFKFFKKKQTEEKITDDNQSQKSSELVSLTFAANIEGDVFVDVFWNESEHELAHTMFAELMSKVVTGELTETIFDVISDISPEHSADIANIYINYIKEKMGSMISGNIDQLVDDELPVVSPTEVVKDYPFNQ